MILHAARGRMVFGVFMTQAQPVSKEPTMEEILASIRRIIEDGNPPLEKAAGEDAGAGEDVAEVTKFEQEFSEDAISESLQHAGAMTALGQKIGARNAAPVVEAAFYHDEDVLLDVPEPAAAAPEGASAPMQQIDVEHVKDETMAAVEHVARHKDDAAAPEVLPEVNETPFERHLKPILSDMAGRQVAAAFSDLTSAIEKERQQSLAEIAEDMIRPMLQEWLDNNLPTMVERLVREEIERVSRSGRQ